MKWPPLILAICLTSGVVDAQETSARDVLTSLKALHAILRIDLDYEEYHRRLIDTKARFDRYAERTAVTVPEAEAKTAMSAAMNYHRFAQSLWATKLQRGGVLPLASFDGLTILLEHFPCPALKSLVDAVMTKYQERGQGDRAAILVERRWGDRAVPLLWACAADKIAEAERIIGTTKR
jgi:hypothetical protein